MKKTSDSEPGWYEDPEDETRERFWNGKYWETDTRLIGEEIESPLAFGDIHLGPLLFRKPINRDNAFKVYAVIVSLSAISGIYGEFQAETRTSLIPVMMIGVIPIMALYIYVLFLPYLIYRRRKDKKQGIVSAAPERIKTGKSKLFVSSGIAVSVLLVLYFIGGGSSSKNSEIESFLKYQEEITEVLARYNAEAGAAVGVVRGISDQTLSAGEGIAQFSAASSKVTQILRELRTVCEDISFPEISGQGEELAIAKGMNVLKVACDVTPKQFLVLNDIFREQVNEDGTQSRLDQLSTELQSLNAEKTKAAIDGINAMLPYANEAQASLMKSLLEGFANR